MPTGGMESMAWVAARLQPVCEGRLDDVAGRRQSHDQATAVIGAGFIAPWLLFPIVDRPAGKC